MFKCKAWRVTLYFFDSKESSGLMTGGMTLAALALAMWEEERGQSLVMCLGCPQNMHSLFLKWRWCSSFMSLPSLPSCEDKSEVVEDFLVEVGMEEGVEGGGIGLVLLLTE